MPTAAKLISAICMAALAAVVSLQVLEQLPPEMNPGNFLPINVAIGALIGWLWLGPNSGDGFGNSVSIGLTSGGMLFVICLLCHAAIEMFKKAYDHKYDGPAEAMGGIFVEAFDFANYVSTQSALTLALGGIVAGIFADRTARKYS